MNKALVGLLDVFSIYTKSSDSSVGVLRFIRASFIVITLIILSLLFAHFFKGGVILWLSILNCFVIICATSIIGYLFGFLFGIPRSVRFKFDKSKNTTSDASILFGDNTNLEEVSDWLTKILVGLALVEFREIASLFDRVATTIASSFSNGVPNNIYTTLSYGILNSYIGIGFFAGYFWTRTKFGTLLTISRKEQEDIARNAFKDINQNLSNVEDIDLKAEVQEAFNDIGDINKDKAMRLSELKRLVSNLLVRTPVLVPDDTQAGRWGGMSEDNGRRLFAEVKPSSYPNLYDVIITVEATNNTQLTSTVVVLLDSTFPQPEIYLMPVNNKATVRIVAYEAFTVAALCDNTITKLELNLNKQKGYPESFYYED
ncbi:pYEATS domain-containing protein [Telluribacter humicola]|uniref:pYEATS domain-containing protein n=1 Tax=Telluribacter humicola TaxID=1720261 RepID=UPI001A975AC3|nr:pYEATS domain-containing protein [Telluribacter humicola]